MRALCLHKIRSQELQIYNFILVVNTYTLSLPISCYQLSVLIIFWSKFTAFRLPLEGKYFNP